MTSPRRKSTVISKCDGHKADGKKALKSSEIFESLYDLGPFSLVKMLSPDEVATIDYVFSGSSNPNKQ